MTTPTQIIECPKDEITAYIDGELDLVRVNELDAHFAKCHPCSLDLNSQKQFLCGLNHSLKNEADIKLPANFTRLIVARAESTVSGLRRPSEIYNAVFICVGLALFVLFALGAEAGSLVDGIYNILGQIAVVSGFFGHIVYSVFVGVAIILRSFGSQVGFDTALAGAAGFFVFLLMFFSRKMFRLPRV